MAEENPPHSVPETDDELSADPSPLADTNRDRTAPVRRASNRRRNYHNSGRDRGGAGRRRIPVAILEQL